MLASSHIQYKGIKYSREKMLLKDLLPEARAKEFAIAVVEQQNRQQSQSVSETELLVEIKQF